MKLPVNYERLTQQQRRNVRLLYIEQQKGLCAHCDRLLTGSPRGDVMTYPINE